MATRTSGAEGRSLDQPSVTIRRPTSGAVPNECSLLLLRLPHVYRLDYRPRGVVRMCTLLHGCHQGYGCDAIGCKDQVGPLPARRHYAVPIVEVYRWRPHRQVPLGTGIARSAIATVPAPRVTVEAGRMAAATPVVDDRVKAAARVDPICRVLCPM